MVRSLALSLSLAALPLAALAQDSVVPLQPGETRLSDIGVYRVGYTSYGGQPVLMPPGWTGHFETVSGISYLPSENLLGRQAILLHTPWRVPVGVAWVEYRLRIPQAKPVTLSFGVAMRPDVAVPDKSDGVTFGCVLVVDGQVRPLMREHWAKAEWRDFSFDLSAEAGREVELRLQTEPGPAGNPSWDYSYFGDARIQVGDSATSAQAELDRLTGTRAYRATAEANRATLANDPSGGILPSNLLPHTNDLVPEGDAWLFRYRAEDATLVYRYQPQTGTLDDVTAQVDDGPVFQPAAGGGLTAVSSGAGEATALVPLRGGRLVRAEPDRERRALTVLWEYTLDDRPVPATWRFGIARKALTVGVQCEQPVVARFSLGSVAGAALRRPFSVPYLPAGWDRSSVAYLPASSLFVGRYLDWTRSHASVCPQGEATYDQTTDGKRNPLEESGYVSVSPDLGEVLPNVPHPPSPYLALLGPRLMLDIWGHHQGTYRGDAANLRELKDNGVDHLAIIQHVWQRYGYDAKLPDHLPANPEFGGDEGMAEFGTTARECDYVWSVHENYIDLYPDAPSYDPAARVLLADGKPSPAWFNAGTGVQSYGLKCNRALGYARQNSPEIHSRFGTTAAYLDVHTCVPPWHQLDHEAGQPMAGMAMAKVRFDTELFRFMRETHGGPLFGEGANHAYWAGACDGVEAQVIDGENHAPLLDFDLLKIHPQMVNHGMGYYERWYTAGYNARFGHDAGTQEQLDKYRAQTLAYGHAGFIGASQVDNVQWVAREHHLLHPVQRLYGPARATAIHYEVQGRMVTASVALPLGERLRQRISYDSGLRVWVNWGPQPWTVEGRALPQWGVLALGPGTEVWTQLVDGRVVDYAECPEFLFADARTDIRMPYVGRDRDIEPRLLGFDYLGGNRVRLSYAWAVNDTLDTDYHCFVHFLAADAKGEERIAFQQDHEPPAPTSQWRRGQTIQDGPYEIEIPAAAATGYDVVIGLHKGERVPLKGLQEGGRVYIGRLVVERQGEAVTKVTLGDLEDVRKRLTVGRADLAVRLNPAGTRVETAKLTTDGAVKVNREPKRLVVFPYPRDREFAVSLDLRAIIADGAADPARAKVAAMAAGTQAAMPDAVPVTATGGRITFRVGHPGAGRYVVTW